MENLIEKAKTFISVKSQKVYTLLKGNFPEVSTKANAFNPHTLILGEAILRLIAEGKEKATKEEIVEKAENLKDEKGNDIGLHAIKPSKSNGNYIFSWWLSSLRTNNFIG